MCPKPLYVQLDVVDAVAFGIDNGEWHSVADCVGCSDSKHVFVAGAVSHCVPHAVADADVEPSAIGFADRVPVNLRYTKQVALAQRITDSVRRINADTVTKPVTDSEPRLIAQPNDVPESTCFADASGNTQWIADGDSELDDIAGCNGLSDEILVFVGHPIAFSHGKLYRDAESDGIWNSQPLDVVDFEHDAEFQRFAV